MKFSHLFVIILAALIISVLTMSILRLIGFEDNISIAGGVVGGLLGAVVGRKLKSD